MRRTLALPMVLSALVLAGCMDQSAREQVGAGAAAGAVGAVAAQLLGASDAWTVIAAGAAATTGALYARNRQTDQCAYGTGNGEDVVIRACNCWSDRLPKRQN